MPAKNVSVNLLEKDTFDSSPIGRIITWATSYGRYIMITTEIVVLLAFISRFSLDRKLTDLNEAISQKQAIIEANLPFENDVKRIQKELARIKTFANTQNKPVDMLALLKTLMPQGVYLETITVTQNQLSAGVIATSVESFGTFLTNISQTKQFLKVDIGSIKKDPVKGISFHISIGTGTPKTSKPVQTNTAPLN